MKSKRFLVYFLIIIFISCDNNRKADSESLDSDVTEKIVKEKKPNSKELLNNAKDYFSNYQIEESKKELLILIKKYPESEEVNEAKELLIKTNLGLERIKIREDSIENVAKKKNEQKIKEVTKNLRKVNDELEGITWYYDKSSPRYVNYNGFFLYIGDSGYGNPNLRLRIQYKSDNWLFIEKYIIFIDGLKYKTIDPEYSEVKRDNGNSGVWEWLDISINSYKFDDDIIDDLTLMSLISTGKDVKIKYIGTKYNKTKTLTNKQKNALKKMLETYSVLGGKRY